MIDVPAWLLDDAAAYDAARDAACSRAAELLAGGEFSLASAALRSGWGADGFDRDAAREPDHPGTLGTGSATAVEP